MKKDPCPNNGCSNLKSYKSKQCQACHFANLPSGPRHPSWIGGPKDICPDCGGFKWRQARRCQGCRGKAMTGSNNHRWRGGRYVDKDGYVRIKMPDHPCSSATGYVLAHRVVMEDVLGRFLTPEETVHHKNGHRDDNHPTNLELFSTSHPPGQRVEDIFRWISDFLFLYTTPEDHEQVKIILANHLPLGVEIDDT